MRLHTKFTCILFAAAAFAGAASAADGGIDRGFGEVPGYTAYGVAGENYIDVGATATSRFNRTWVFVESDPYGTQLHLSRMFSSSGLLDTGFGPNQDGHRNVTLPAGLAGPALNGAIAQQDGMVLAFGRLRNTIDNDYAGFICRFAAAGNLHSAFGTNGCTTVRSMIPGNESLEVTAATEDNFGRIVIAGKYAAQNQNPPHISHRFIARLGTNGLFDPEFAGGVGFITLPKHAGDNQVQHAEAVRVDAVGRILLLSTISIAFASNDLDVLVQRFDDGGGLDPEFASAGTRMISFNEGFAKHDSGRGMVVMPDGRIVVLVLRSSASAEVALLRFNADATQLDPAFNGGAARFETLPDDQVLTDFGPLVVDDIGRSYVVAEGGSYAMRRTIVLRHRLNGTPDPDFGVAGRTEITGQELTGDPTLNAFRSIGATIAGRDQLLITGTVSDEDFTAKRALTYALDADGLFSDSFE